MSESGEFAMWLAVGAGQLAFWWAMSPLIRAFADRIARRGAGGERLELLEARLSALEQRHPTTGEVELQQQRLAELEERVDFAERILTHHGSTAAGRENA
jgi:predicted nuclease with TOPRIM domain